MFDKLRRKSEAAESSGLNANAAGPADAKPKKSLYQRYQDSKTGRNNQISDADLLKYTGKTKAELNEWAKDQPNVAANQLAGKVGMGSTPVGGPVAYGYDGGAPMKFPPKPQQSQKVADEDDSE